jgi:adenylate cyclase
MHLYIFPYSEHMHSPEMLRQARAAAEKAVMLDPEFSTGQATLGHTLMWAREHDASLAAFQKALALNRNDGLAQRLYAFALSLSGRHEDSIQIWQSAERSDPYLPAVSYGVRAIPHIMLGEYRQALSLARTCFQRSPRMISCSWYEAIAAVALGLEEEAAEAAKRVLEINPRFTITGTYLKIVPFSSEETAAKIADYMRRAGLPE